MGQREREERVSARGFVEPKEGRPCEARPSCRCRIPCRAPALSGPTLRRVDRARRGHAPARRPGCRHRAGGRGGGGCPPASRLRAKARALADDGSSHWTSSIATRIGSRAASSCSAVRTATARVRKSTGSSASSRGEERSRARAAAGQAAPAARRRARPRAGLPARHGRLRARPRRVERRGHVARAPALPRRRRARASTSRSPPRPPGRAPPGAQPPGRGSRRAPPTPPRGRRSRLPSPPVIVTRPRRKVSLPSVRLGRAICATYHPRRETRTLAARRARAGREPRDRPRRGRRNRARRRQGRSCSSRGGAAQPAGSVGRQQPLREPRAQQHLVRLPDPQQQGRIRAPPVHRQAEARQPKPTDRPLHVQAGRGVERRQGGHRGRLPRHLAGVHEPGVQRGQPHGWEDIASVGGGNGKTVTVEFKKVYAAWESLVSSGPYPAHIIAGKNMNEMFLELDAGLERPVAVRQLEQGSVDHASGRTRASRRASRRR